MMVYAFGRGHHHLTKTLRLILQMTIILSRSASVITNSLSKDYPHPTLDARGFLREEP